AGVIIKPPQGGLNEDHEVRPRLAEPFELADRGGVVSRLAPVSPLALQEGDAAASGENGAAPPRILIHEDKGIPLRYDRCDPPQPAGDLVPPAIRPPRPRIGRKAQGSAAAAQGVETMLLAAQAGAKAPLERLAPAVVLAVRPPAALWLRNLSYGSEEGGQAAQVQVWRSAELPFGNGKDPLQERPRPGV